MCVFVVGLLEYSWGKYLVILMTLLFLLYPNLINNYAQKGTFLTLCILITCNFSIPSMLSVMFNAVTLMQLVM